MKLLLTFVVIAILGWDAFWWLMGVRPIGPWHLKRLLPPSLTGSPEPHTAPEPEAPLLVDVRTPAEFAWFHIEGANNYPMVLNDPGTLIDDRRRPIVVLCLSGHRSPVAAYQLKKHGFQNVSYLSWGMLAWVLSGGSVAKGAAGG
jgi:rhodanese-related sulfurtransferase